MRSVTLDQSPGTVKVLEDGSFVHIPYLPWSSVGAGIPPSSMITSCPLGVVTLESQLTLLNVVRSLVEL